MMAIKNLTDNRNEGGFSIIRIIKFKFYKILATTQAYNYMI